MAKRIWNLVVPEPLDRKLKDYLNDPRAIYSTKSEFIRDAVNKQLEALSGENNK